MTLIFFFFFLGGGGGCEEVRWKTVRTYGKILATPLLIVIIQLYNNNCTTKNTGTCLRIPRHFFWHIRGHIYIFRLGKFDLRQLWFKNILAMHQAIKPLPTPPILIGGCPGQTGRFTPYLHQVTVIFKHISAGLSSARFVLKIEHWSFHNAWHLHCFWVTCYAHKNIDSPYVFELWATSVLREVSMRRFSSLTEKRHVLRDPKQTPDLGCCCCCTVIHVMT